MREILFRGKRLDNGEWIYGGYFKHNNRQKCVIGDSDKPEDFDDLIFVSGFADWNMPRPLNYAKVIPGTVGQHTGIDDRNGKKIFEGDIVSFTRINALGYTTKRVGTVKYYDKLPIFYIMATTGDAWDWVECGDIEVIGNIYDNQELLEVHDE